MEEVKEKKGWKVRRVYDIFMVFFTLFLAGALIFECADVYSAGYDVEYVKEKISLLVAPFVVFIVFAIFGIFVEKEEENIKKIEKNYKKVAFFENNRAKLWANIINLIVILFACSFCIYKFVTFKYDENIDINSQVLDLVKSILPFIILMFVSNFVLSFFRVKNKEKIGFFDNEKFIFSVRIILFLLALAFIIVGVLTEGYKDVLVKATKICRECIGIG